MVATADTDIQSTLINHCKWVFLFAESFIKPVGFAGRSMGDAVHFMRYCVLVRFFLHLIRTAFAI